MADSIFKDKTLLITGGTGSFGHTVLKHFLSTDIGESFIRFNVEDLLPKIAPRAVFVGHGYYNELHQRVEAEEAYRLANEPKQLYYVDGKHNEWMFDEDPKFQALAAALADFYKEHLKPMEFGLQK